MILENPRFWKDFVDSNKFDISWQNVDGGGVEYSQLFSRSDFSSTSGWCRYDEIIAKAGMSLNLLNTSDFAID